MGQDPLIGRQLGNFRIERLVGSGGMAQVYYGWDVVLQRPVAVKVIAQRYRHHTSYTERFLREARTVARWRHEHIVQVYHAAEEDGLYYLVMEYVDGSDLAALLQAYHKAGERLPHDELLRIARDVAGALDFAHQRDVIHRDVKPSNVLITAEGRVLLSDFGLVLDRREGSSGEVLGSPSYVAPEQALRSASAVPQSDLYSLAVILYEMLVGRPPFDDPSPTSLALQHITASPPPPNTFNPDLNEETSRVLLKALSKKPEERYQSGAALVQALSAALGVAPAAEPLVRPQPRQEGESREAETHPTDPSPPPRLSDIPTGLDTGGESSGPPLVAAPTPSRRPRRSPSLLGRLLWMGMGFALVMLAGLVVAFLLLRGDGARDGALGGLPLGNDDGAQNGVALTPEGDDAGAPGEMSEAPQDQPGDTGNGRPLILLYNDASFYVHNPGPGDLATADLAFEALDGQGQPAGYALDGERWAVFYPAIQPGNCNRVTIIDASGYLSPPACAAYNALLTPERSDEMIFWTPREEVAAFRVLWRGQEAGRCDVTAQRCEVALP